MVRTGKTKRHKMKSLDRGFESEKRQAMGQGLHNISTSEPDCSIQ